MFKFNKKKSNIHGYGLFAQDFIPANKILFLVADLDKLIANEDWITQKAKLINHTINPNTNFVRVKNKYYLYSLKDILPNEELTLDYSSLGYPFKTDVRGYK